MMAGSDDEFEDLLCTEKERDEWGGIDPDNHTLVTLRCWALPILLPLCVVVRHCLSHPHPLDLKIRLPTHSLTLTTGCQTTAPSGGQTPSTLPPLTVSTGGHTMHTLPPVTLSTARQKTHSPQSRSRELGRQRTHSPQSRSRQPGRQCTHSPHSPHSRSRQPVRHTEAGLPPRSPHSLHSLLQEVR